MMASSIIRALCILLGLLWGQAIYAQSSNLPIGTWQVHVPNNRAKAIAETPDAVYCVTEDGFFRYLKADQSLKTLSRLDGLSDVNTSTLTYDSVTSTLLVAYENTNLDLIKDGRVTNLSELLRKQMTGVKVIHHLYTHQKKAYVATSFGLVVLDLIKLEIKDTYSYIGSQGEMVQVFGAAVLNDSLYITSSQGVMGASLASTNLLDYKNWKRFGPAQGLPAGPGSDPIKTIAAFEGGIYVGVHDTGLYRYNGNMWTKAPFSTANNQFRSIATNGKRLVVTGASEVIELTASGQIATKTDPLFQDLRMAIPARGAGIWAASYTNGLIQVAGAGTQALVPNGPAFVDVFSVYAEPSGFTVLGGGYSEGYLQRSSNAGYYQYQNGQWTSYRTLAGGAYPEYVRDYVAALRNPVTNKFYIATYGSGLLEWHGEAVTLYNETNSPLRSALRPGDQYYVRVLGLAIDAQGSVWVTNRNQQANVAGLLQLKPDGVWQAHPFPGFGLMNSLDKILVDDQGYKWVSISTNAGGTGVVVYDDIRQKYQYLGGTGQGGLPSTQVYSLALDLNGEIWVGTGDGVAVFTSSPDIFSSNYAGAYLPIYERRPLLQGQNIRSIAVDGGNRKWIGTDTGLWLFSESGEELIAHFTTKNSPLPSDRIIGITIHHATGDVLIGTEGGVAIYRGTATRTENLNKNCLQVFPNPVRAGFTGSIGITGVPNNGWVKITDTAGILVYEGKPAGGTFAWNGNDYNGRKAKPGVYIVMAASADGSQTCTTKIAIQ